MTKVTPSIMTSVIARVRAVSDSRSSLGFGFDGGWNPVVRREEPTSDSRHAFGTRGALALYPFPTAVGFVCIQPAFSRWLMVGAALSGLGQCPVRPIHRLR